MEKNKTKLSWKLNLSIFSVANECQPFPARTYVIMQPLEETLSTYYFPIFVFLKCYFSLFWRKKIKSRLKQWQWCFQFFQTSLFQMDLWKNVKRLNKHGVHFTFVNSCFFTTKRFVLKFSKVSPEWKNVFGLWKDIYWCVVSCFQKSRRKKQTFQKLNALKTSPGNIFFFP